MTQARLTHYRELAKVAERAGFIWVRCAGSHTVFQHRGGRIVVIPNHESRPIGRGLLNKILRQMVLSVETYHQLLDE